MDMSKKKSLINAILYIHYRLIDSFDSLLVCLENGREEWKLFVEEVARYSAMEEALLKKLYTMEAV